jgi:hypothetical protein
MKVTVFKPGREEPAIVADYSGETPELSALAEVVLARDSRSWRVAAGWSDDKTDPWVARQILQAYAERRGWRLVSRGFGDSPDEESLQKGEIG